MYFRIKVEAIEKPITDNHNTFYELLEFKKKKKEIIYEVWKKKDKGKTTIFIGGIIEMITFNNFIVGISCFKFLNDINCDPSLFQI